MTAREEFNRMLNASLYPRAAYNTLSALAASISSQTPDNPRAALLEGLKKGESK